MKKIKLCVCVNTRGCVCEEVILPQQIEIEYSHK